MQINFQWVSGLVFGLEADVFHEMNDEGELTGEASQGITIYLGVVSIDLLF